MEARSQSAAHPNEMNFIFNLNAFSWKAMQRAARRDDRNRDQAAPLGLESF
jgi:hypothetical protein